jgi:hypothetical protein
VKLPPKRNRAIMGRSLPRKKLRPQKEKLLPKKKILHPRKWMDNFNEELRTYVL